MKPINRLLHIVYSLDVEGPGGGITRFTSELARELTGLSFEVTLCGLWDYGTDFEHQQRLDLQADGVATFTCAPWTGERLTRGFLAAVRTLFARQRQKNFQLVHSHSEFGDIAALMMGLAHPRLPLLRTVHYGYGVEWRRKPLRRYLFTNFLIPLRYSREIGVSPQIVQTLDERPLGGAIGKPGLYINNAVNLTRFSASPEDAATLRKSLEIPDSAFVIGSVGRLTEQKAYDVLAAAASLALAENPHLFFIIVGEGEDRPELEALISQLGIGGQVRLLGSRPDVDRLLGVMDLFVSASRWEGLPTVILESLASGVPVVATDIPGSRELVYPGESGWLAQPNDPQDLAARILQAVEAEKLRQVYARRSREIAEEYSIKKVARKYADLYRSLSGQ